MQKKELITVAKSKWPHIEENLDKIVEWTKAGYLEKDICIILGSSKSTWEKHKREQIEATIHDQAEQYIPFDINDVNLDYVPLPSMEGENLEVILVAVKKEKINDYTSIITQAGKTAALVDVDAFAVQNAYETSYDVVAGDTLTEILAARPAPWPAAPTTRT